MIVWQGEVLWTATNTTVADLHFSLMLSNHTVRRIFFPSHSEDLGNACGAIALFHAVANQPELRKHVGKDTTLAQFLEEAEDMSPRARGELMDEFEELAEQQQEVANE